MNNSISKFSAFEIPKAALKKVKGGITEYSCEMHFHSGGIEHVKKADVSSSSIENAEQYNSFGQVNGTTTYTCCKVKNEF